MTSIPVRTANRPKIETRQKRRRKQAENFGHDGYDGHRPKVELTFSVEKRMTGLTVLARNSSQQHKELAFWESHTTCGGWDASLCRSSRILHGAYSAELKYRFVVLGNQRKLEESA